MKLNLSKFQKYQHKILFFVVLSFVMSFQPAMATNHSPINNNIDKVDVLSISGVVTSAEDNEPLIGATVTLKSDPSKGTVTDINGAYQIEADANDVLVFSYTGMQTQEVPVSGQSTIDVAMNTDAAVLEEVVVVGYGTQKKSHLTGAISKVENKRLDQMAVPRVDDALVGQVSGVNVQNTSGDVGDAPTIRIRGTGSITGNAGPLVVLDGVVVDADFLNNLDMNDVESFEVLKDAASAAIYGSRGGNGVIMITTKDGAEGPTTFNYHTFWGRKDAHHSDAYTFSVAETAAAEMAANGELSARTRYKQLIGIDRDWQEEIFDGGNVNSHALSARGGNKRTNFSASLSYLDDEGVLLTDHFTRYAAQLKVNTKVTDRISIGANLSPSLSDRRRFDGSTHDILRQTPWLPVYHDENTIQYVDRNVYPDVQVGDYAVQRHFDNYDLDGDGTLIDISNTSNTNPAAKVIERQYTDEKFKIFGSLYAKLKIADGLNFRTSLSGNYQDTNRRRWQGVKANRNGASAAQLDLWDINRTRVVFDNILTYDTEINGHEINAIVGTSAEEVDNSYATTRGTGYESDLIQTITAATTIALGESYTFENNLLSFFGRVNYAYNDKYLVSLSYRRDASSVFGLDNKYGNFPAASIGWNVGREDFLADNNLISRLKLRLSYGVTGNNSLDAGDILIENYPSLSLLGTSTAVVNGEIVSGINALNVANPELQWEGSIEFNPGIDFGILEDRLTGSLDFYNRTSNQLLLNNPVSSTTGFTTALVNIGEVSNTGIEFEMRTRNVVTSNFTWATTAIASRNENTLLDFADSDGQIQSVDSKRPAEWINLEGHPISSFYGYVVDREIPLEYITDPYHPVGATSQDIYVKDLNGDGLIDDDDKTILGDPYPNFIWSVTNEFRIFDFDFSFMLQGSHGAEVRNIADQYLFNQFNSQQDFTADTPDQEFIQQRIFTSDQVMNASYVSLRNINLGYNVPSSAVAATRFLNSARLYVAAQNLLYIMADDYTGWNPEAIRETSPTTYGYQRGGSPIFRSFTVGLKAGF